MVEIYIKVIAKDFEDALASVQDLLDQSEEYSHIQRENSNGFLEVLEVKETKTPKTEKTKK